MLKLHQIILRSILIVSFWLTGLYLFADYRVDHYGVKTEFPYYNILLTKVQNPKQAVWAYFDGAHYVRLAENGYVDQGTQAFFPVYPALIRIVKNLTHLPIILVGQIISIFFLIGSLVLLQLLFPQVLLYLIASLLLFPTSFFFSLVYTESLFLFLTLLFFYLLKLRKYGYAALVAALASGTRLVGVFLSISLLIELYQQKQKSISYLYIPLSLLGFILYSIFLYINFGDPLKYMHVQGMFGAGRSTSELVLLPQVLYRYLKMLFTVDISSLLYHRLMLELVTFMVFSWIWFKNLRKIPLSHSFYVGSSLLLPTLTGTLSSIPRYVLVLIPFLLSTINQKYTKIALLISTFLLAYFFWVYVGGAFIA